MKYALNTILFIFIAFVVKAQGDECQKTTEGTDFWFGFMENRNPPEDSTETEHRYVEVTVTAKETTSFQINIGSDEIPFGPIYSVDANSSQKVKIDWELVEAIGSEQIEDKGIHLTSQKPVNVYAISWDVNSADVAVIYPTVSLGTEYFAMCYYPNIDLINGRNSEFLIVGTEDFTNVEITPSKVTDQNKPADSTFTIVLNKGEVYQVQSENIFETHAEGQGDLTGSYVKADKPVAFFSGSLATTVPGGTCCWDHLYEQIPPVHTWGREYFAVPLYSREQDRYRIIAAENQTTIYISERPPVTIDRGEFWEAVFNYTDPKRIIADKPVMVAQFSQSNTIDSTFTGGDGDPFMIILSSTAQQKNDVTFVTYQSPDIVLENQPYDGIQQYYINIIAKTEYVENIQLNGLPIQDDFLLFPGNDSYSYAQKEIESGTHRLNNTNKEQGFLAYVYGFGGYESYGYGVGFNLNLVLDLVGSPFFVRDTMLLCQGDTLTIDAGPYFDNYYWRNTAENAQKIKVTDPGWYYVRATTYEGCELEDSVYVFKSYPQTDLGLENVVEDCEPFSIELSGDNGYKKYLWQNETGDTLSTLQDYVADKTGKYRITVFDEYNCSASDQMELVIYPIPKIEYQGEILFCDIDTATLNLEITGVPEDIWNYDGSYNWSTNNPDIILSNKTHTSVKIKAENPGSYKIFYGLTTTDNCEIFDTLNISFYPSPASDFKFNIPGECGDYTREIKYTGGSPESASFYWDFGDSQVIDSISWDNYIVSLGTDNSNQNIQLVVEENGCYSEVTSKTIGANPNFRMETSKTRGCDSLTVLFESELLVPESVEYEWNFGDGTPINYDQNPEHSYPDVGFYDVNLTVTNQENGCVAGLQIDSLVKVFPTPIAAISADPEYCYNDSAQIFYTYNIDSTIAYWSFKGMHQSGSGNDSILVVLDEPVGEVMLTVDEYGCLSDTTFMQLKRKPHFDFYTEYETGCAPHNAQIFAQPFDNFLDFQWMTDSLPYPVGESNTFQFTDAGDYNIGLIAYSSQTECFDTLIKNTWITVNPSPEADFNVDYSVALIDNSTITFTNSSFDADYYDWDFGDEQFSTDKHPQHSYQEVGEYDVVLIVESEIGCTDTTNYLIKILPTTSYTPNAFRPDSPIEENRTFMPVGDDAVQLNFELKIFDRSGQIMFETNSTNRPWDGNTMKGNPAPMGNYVWVADFVDIQGLDRHQKGQVLLIR